MRTLFRYVAFAVDCIVDLRFFFFKKITSTSMVAIKGTYTTYLYWNRNYLSVGIRYTGRFNFINVKLFELT